MKNKHNNRIFYMLVAFLLCVVMIVGCATAKTGSNADDIKITAMDKEESEAISFSFLGGKDVMPIGGYFGPYLTHTSRDGDVFPEYVSDEYFEMIADAGVNLVLHSNMSYSMNPDYVIKSLELGEKYGVGIFVNDSNVLKYAGMEGVSAADIGEEVANYSDYEAFCGMYLVDEPQAPYYMPGDGSRYISTYKELAKILQYDLNLTCYINMFPLSNIEENQEKYTQYVDEVCETFNPTYLLWDKYPFDSADKLDVYFNNMDLMRTKAKELQIPFWTFIQAGGQWNDAREYFDSKLPYYPNEAQFNWNVNTCLAFGAQGLTYFPLIQPEHFAYAESTEWDFNRNGIIGAAGNKNQWYYYAQNINKHIGAIDEVLMNSVNKGVIVNGKDAKKDTELVECVIESGKFQELMSVSGDAMVGCFNYNGKTALYVVNYSMERSQKIDLQFNDTHKIEVIKNAKSSYVKAQNLQLDMAAGEGILLVVK